MSGHDISFGRFSLNLRSRVLSRDGTRIPLGNRALDILCALAAAKGEVVTKDQLMEKVWLGRVVEENNIHVHVAALRKALDQERDAQSHVVTVPGRGYRLVDVQAATDRTEVQDFEALAVQGKPSIAVLPFQNMSDDAEQQHFADGIVEEITTGLAHIRWISVVARNSSFAYGGRTIDVRQIGRELGAHYVLEGSVRKAGHRVRITAQLVDAVSGAHVWADRFDGGLDDVFALQDQITASVVGAIEPNMVRAEIERRQHKPATNTWDYLAKGTANLQRHTRETNGEALGLFRRAMELDANLALPFALASQCYTWAKSFGWLTNPPSELAEGAILARRALELGRDDAGCLCAGGFGVAYLASDLDVGRAAIDRALVLNPNFAAASAMSGWIRIYLGEPQPALAHVERAIQLSPSNTAMFAWQSAGAYALFSSGRYDEALSWAQNALREHPGYLPAARMRVAAAALAGRSAEQPEFSVARLLALEPGLRTSNLSDQIPYRRPEDLARLADALRKAGLPE
jgi:TolB-like protein/tetratricopeptide (TPR) repeat protein